MNGENRLDLSIGMEVMVVEKQNQKNGVLTFGVIAKVLTKSSNHPYGIKVMLEDGKVGRVKEIVKK